MTKPMHIKTEEGTTSSTKSAKSTTINNRKKGNNTSNNSKRKVPPPVQFEVVISNAGQLLEAGRYDEAIDQTSLVMQEFQKNAVRVLTLQATALARKHKYQAELKSAWMMINFAPTNPAGYLIAGRRYIDQGLQERAIEVFNKGLKSVSFSESDYELLQDGKIQAQNKSKKRIDLVTLLPFDLTSSIMKYVDPETVAESTLVSKDWNRKLLNNHVCRQKIVAFKRMQYTAPSPLANHGKTWLPSHEDALVFYKKQGIEIARIAQRLGRTASAAAARYSMIYRSYQGFGGNRLPSRLPLQYQ